MKRIALVLSLLVAACGGLVFATSYAQEGTCVDANAKTQNGVRRIFLTNTCNKTLQVRIKAAHGPHAVCEVMRIEPRVTRTFDQQEFCHGNQVFRSCICERRIEWEERETR